MNRFLGGRCRSHLSQAHRIRRELEAGRTVALVQANGTLYLRQTREDFINVTFEAKESITVLPYISITDEF